MTLLLLDPMQDANLYRKPGWSVTGWDSIQTGRFGETTGAAGPVYNSQQVFTFLAGTVTTFIYGLAFRVYNPVTFGTTNGAPMHFGSPCVASAQQITPYVNATGYIEFRRGAFNGTLLGISSGHPPLTSGVWHYFEMKSTSHATTGTLEARLDGVTVFTFTGNTGTTGQYNQWRLSCGQGDSAIWYDDIYMLDGVDATATQGAPYNDFLGDIRVGVIYPSAAGDTTGWTPSTGSNWAAVDEVPPNTTDYVAANGATTGLRDLYQMTDLTGLNSVLAVQELFYALKTDAGTAVIKPVIKENGVVTVSASQAVGTTYTPVYAPVFTRRPSDGAAWTMTDINALQAGVEVG